MRRALTYQDRLMPLHQALFLEPNPTGVKYALSVLGKIGEDVRLPLVKVSEPTRSADPLGDGPCRPDQLSRRWPQEGQAGGEGRRGQPPRAIQL